MPRPQFPPRQQIVRPRFDPARPMPKQIGTKTTIINGSEYIVRVFEPAGFAPRPDDAGLPVGRIGKVRYVEY